MNKKRSVVEIGIMENGIKRSSKNPSLDMCWSNIPQRIDGYHRRRRFSNSRTKPWSKDGSSYVRSIVIPHRIEYDRILIVSSSRLTKFKQQTFYSSFYTQFMEYFYEIRSDYLDFFQPRMKLRFKYIFIQWKINFKGVRKFIPPVLTYPYVLVTYT